MFSIADLITFSSVAASLAAIYLASRIQSALTAWNVRQAWNWMLAALTALLTHSIASIPQFKFGDAVISSTAYFAATMLLTPLVTILGARRPGISAWHWFVVLPMVLVLQWPAISQLSGNHWRAPIELSAPSLMGIVVVLVMSAGTLLGTSSSIFAILYSSGIIFLLMSVTNLAWGKTAFTPLSTVLVLLALWTARRNLIHKLRQLDTSKNASQRTQAVWNLFSCLHGFAWMRRVQDRVNQFGPRERWNVQLTALGFRRSIGAHNQELTSDRLQDIDPGDEELTQPVEAFIWVLARFADEVWLRQKLQNPQNPNIPCDPSNSTN